MRISRQQMFMEMAHTAAKRSTCFRLNVGAIVTVNNRVVSIGYNGSPAGMPHCAGNECNFHNGGCGRSIHAERNALNEVPQGLWSTPKDLYITDSPCFECTELILNRRVRRLFFDRLYRLNDHLQKLPLNGTEVYRVTPSGYIVDLQDKIIEDLK